MVEIQCLVCSKVLKIPKSVDTNKFEGQILCQECKSLLYIKLVNEKVQKYRILDRFKPEIVQPVKIE